MTWRVSKSARPWRPAHTPQTSRIRYRCPSISRSNWSTRDRIDDPPPPGLQSGGSRERPDADGRHGLLGGPNGTISVWNLQSGHLRTTLHGHQESVQSVARSADNRFPVSGIDAILHPGASLTRADHDRLMVMLERVSFGWLRRDTVVAEPELMWRDQPGVRRVLEQASDLERMSSRRESPAWRGRGG